MSQGVGDAPNRGARKSAANLRSLPRDYIVGIVEVSALCCVFSERPGNHALSKRARASSGVGRVRVCCDLVVVVAVNFYVVRIAPRIEIAARECRRTYATARIASILDGRRADKDDLPRVQGGRNSPKFIKQGLVWVGSAGAVDEIGCCPAGNRILAVLRIKRIHRGHDLGQIVLGLGFFGLVLDAAEGRESQADQNRNDRDDNEQFDERESAARA